ncbi:MAG: hypothetical protein M1838_001193 [Thelocarpon superellum]|nr:MAG: hypothetical protein M1838_001193 [Thelocarpon superellum]
MSSTNPPRALFFDVFGTVVDWRSSVTDGLHDAAQRRLASTAPTANDVPSEVRAHITRLSREDWAIFAQQWRDNYVVFTRTFHPQTGGWVSVDTHHRQSLQSLLSQWQLDGFYSDAEITELSRIWHFLTPWPDSPSGLTLLGQQGFTTATLSNGNVELLTDMAEKAGLTWTHVFSAEHFGAYKPHPSVYRGAAQKLGLAEQECAMVAAHLFDLKAAKSCGLQTIYVERDGEEECSAAEIQQARDAGWVDLWIGREQGEDGVLTVAERLGDAPRPPG